MQRNSRNLSKTKTRFISDHALIEGASCTPHTVHELTPHRNANRLPWLLEFFARIGSIITDAFDSFCEAGYTGAPCQLFRHFSLLQLVAPLTMMVLPANELGNIKYSLIFCLRKAQRSDVIEGPAWIFLL